MGVNTSNVAKDCPECSKPMKAYQSLEGETRYCCIHVPPPRLFFPLFDEDRQADAMRLFALDYIIAPPSSRDLRRQLRVSVT